MPNTYSVIYFPYSGPGGAVPSRRIEGGENLKDFLEVKIRLRKDVVDSAVKELSESGNASVPNVQLRSQELKRLGLA